MVGLLLQIYITCWDPSSCKSNQLPIDNVHFSLIPLKWLVIDSFEIQLVMFPTHPGILELTWLSSILTSSYVTELSFICQLNWFIYD